MTSSPKKLRAAIDKFKAARILVIGDIIIDHFIWGSVSRISPEAPVPVVNVTKESLLLGGAANVLHNLYSLGAQADLCGIIGEDLMGNHIIELLHGLGSQTLGVIKADDRPTTKKTRIVAQHQQVVRFDREKTGKPSAEILARMLDFLDTHLDSFQAIIVSDYSKGMISMELMDHLRKKLAGSKIPIVADPKPINIERFKNVTIMTPNHQEAELMSGIKIENEDDLLTAAGKINQDLQTKAMLITRGEAGMALLEKDKPLFTIPTVAKEVYDVTGAGDTVIATLALGLAVGLSYIEAATLANFAAGIVVGKLGTATVSQDELRGAIK
ncbi:MAG: D-glycero-beta-D-manno-heptose-7-phosphate kinase [Proteobacteria bacterium]|nr:D-glycero-beta-D-manno-heptose-7-phosphate kinase [Pseudomonadota bacterium]MBU1714490.1 D-glycero-beta-D-manno-heptose-7-phosphate kinase [Pseudomonadota bacterium]